MATTMEYKYELVEAGNTGEDGELDVSPNNTILEIADKQMMSKSILMSLNPHLLTIGTIHDKYNDVKIRYKKPNGEYDIYTVPAGLYKTTLIDIANEIKVNTNTLLSIDTNRETLAEHCCFESGYKVLYAVGSMTDSTNGFKTEEYLVEKDNVSLNGIAKEKKIELSTLIKLNPNISQNDIIPKQTIVLLSVKSPSDGTTVTVTEFGLQAGTTRTLFVNWEWDHEHNKTQNYDVKWSYMTSDGKWWVGNESTTKDGTVKESLYTADTLAVAARVSIKPNGKSGILTTTTYAWSTNMTYKFGTNSLNIPSEPRVEIKDLTLTATIEDFDITNENDKYVTYHVVTGPSNNTLSKISDVKGVDTQTLLKLNPGYRIHDTIPVETKIVLSVYPVFVEFEIVRDHGTVIHNSGKVQVYTGYVSYSVSYPTIEEGYGYKVRCRSYVDGLYSNWTGYSSVVYTRPTQPVIYPHIECTSETSILLKWTKINSAETYNIEYVMRNVNAYGNLPKEQYFDNQTITTSAIQGIRAEDVIDNDGVLEYNIFNIIPDSDEPDEWYIRINAANEDSVEPSKWSTIETFVLGTESDAPTTWSSATVGVVGDSLPLILYWIHNSEDGSIETYAHIQLTVDGEVKTISVKKSTDKDEKYETSSWKLNMNEYSEGSEIKWQVQTAGVLKKDGNPLFGKPSIERIINVYAPPALSINLTDYLGNSVKRDSNVYTLQSYPFDINLTAGNYTNQKPTGYYVNIIANEDYKTVDELGNNKTIVAGTRVYTKYIDTNNTKETIRVSANDVNLVNNVSYSIEAIVSMSSGLIATSMTYMEVGWMTTETIPFAEISVDKDTLTASIYPYVLDTEANVLISVYRREFDGSFTEIIANAADKTGIVDPHPSLDYARYRIVSTNQTTGAVAYNDVPGIPVKEKCIVIQWDEEWRSFDVTDATPEQPAYSGSMLKLPYNIDVSNVHNPDVSLVRYVGRKRPVSYYGTQLGESATWSTVIPKHDKDTLYALRRLATYMGNVYVREPSGSGYWANITVSFSQTHNDLTLPITFNVTPVEGGM